MNDNPNAKSQFMAEYPGYENPALDEIRNTQYPALKGAYADWTGAALPPKKLIEDGSKFLMENLIGNPHSHHSPSAFAMEEVKATRRAVLDFFKADPNEYEVIFTPNATGAILLLQHYMFDGGELLLTADNHNSVNGLREIAKRKGAITRYSPINDDLTINEEALMRSLTYPRSNNNRLFCYPAKSNYAGTLHSLDWIETAHEKGWDVLLDAAAFVANNELDLSVIKPDFVPISFYKLFGYPTGIGCLIIKKSMYAKLSKLWFAGGSILLVSVMKDFYAPESIGYARYEDGTINFAGIPQIKNGLEFLSQLKNIGSRAKSLASWLYDQLNGLEVNGNSVMIHSAKGNDTVTFSIKKGDTIIDAWIFEEAANASGVYVRTGCFCNPGVNEKVFGYEIESFENFYNNAVSLTAMTIEELRKYSDNKAIGAIRASFGFANNFEDVEAFAAFTKNFLENL